ncbi:MAG: hypothetical protein J5777_08410 [Clostridiales bacterium]|nr:hypothetical protein [Clostridiales bacterium]
MELKAKKALVIYNESAGIGNSNAAENSVVEALISNGYEVNLSQIKPEENLIWGTGFPDDSGIVVCCGGDGTFNQVINRYIGTEEIPKFSYVPCGHTNSFAKSLGIPDDTGAAIDTVIKGKSYKCDVGKVNEHIFNYVAAFGSASTLNFVTSQQMKKVFEYSKHILRAIGELHMNIGDSFHMAIETDSGSLEGDYIFGAVTNLSAIDGANFGNNDSFKNNDGVMEMMLIRKPDTRSQAKEVLNVLREGAIDHPLIQITRIKRASFVSASDIVWSFDGEYGGIRKEAALEVFKEALTVQIP